MGKMKMKIGIKNNKGKSPYLNDCFNKLQIGSSNANTKSGSANISCVNSSGNDSSKSTQS